MSVVADVGACLYSKLMKPRGPEPETTIRRFFAKVQEPNAEGCWIREGASTKGNYSVFHGYPDENFHKKQTTSHRWSYEHFFGPIPEGAVIDHICHRQADCKLKDSCPHRRCVNPAHLEAVSQGENLIRSGHENFRTKVTSTCKRGHVLEGDAVYIYVNKKTGSTARFCRACRLEWHENNKSVV